MKGTSFIDDTCTPYVLCGHAFSKGKMHELANYRFDRNGDSFIASINIFSKYQRRGIGYEIFRRGYCHFNSQTPIVRFVANWSVSDEYMHLPNSCSTNLSVFRAQRANGIDVIQSLWTTPTGKWLRRLGFLGAKIVKETNFDVQAEFCKRQ